MKARVDTSNTAQTAKCIELMFDKIIAKDMQSSAGIGTDNMTCVVVEIKS
jgi:serine/threonine protein phosphatase PrpC